MHNNTSESSAEALGRAIGERVRNSRVANDFTLDQLAQRAGVSRRMLINIEHGIANPSMAILLRIGDALGVGLPALVEPPREAPIRLTSAEDAAILWRGENGGRGILLAGTRAPNVVELWEWQLQGQERHSSTSHNPGCIELLHIHQGELTLTVDEQVSILKVGDTAEFEGDRTHAYANNRDETAVFSMVVYEPVSGATPRQQRES